MYNILIVSALSLESKFIKNEIKNLDLKNIKTSFLVSWVWNYHTILNLTKYLKENNFDLILNIWVCGYKNFNKDFIQIWRIKNSSDDREIIVPNIIDFWDLESIFCSEKVIYDSYELWEENFVDMESYGFELVCNNFEVPRIILKIPVDKIWIETKNFDIKKAKIYLSKNINYKLLFEKIEKYLNSLDSNNIWIEIKNKILSHYKFSFSENFILEKLVNKFIILELWDIDIFFEKNKNLNKKDFLRKLEW